MDLTARALLCVCECACRLHARSGADIYLAFNAHDYFIKALLPTPPQTRKWVRVVRFSIFGAYPKIHYFLLHT